MKRLPKNKTAPKYMQLDSRLVFPLNSVYVRQIKETERTEECDGFKYAIFNENGRSLGLITEFEYIGLIAEDEDTVLYFAH